MQEFIREFFVIWLIAVFCILACCYLLIDNENNKQTETTLEPQANQLFFKNLNKSFKNLTDKEKLDWCNYDGIVTGLQTWCGYCLSGLEYNNIYASCCNGHKYLIIRDEEELKKIRKEIWDKNRVGKLRKNF